MTSPELVKKRISETLQIPLEKLRDDAAISDLIRESFAVVEMAIDLQEEFDIQIGQEDLARVTTIGDLADLIASH